MESAWYDIKKPPLVTLPVKNVAFAQRIYKHLQNYILSFRRTEKEFKHTALLLLKMTERRKSSFRHMIGFRALQKLNSAIKRLDQINIINDIQNFQSTLTDLDLLSESVHEVGTRDYLDYILLGLFTAHNIHSRIHEQCLAAADYFIKLLYSSFFFDTNALLIGLISKIFSLNSVSDNNCIDLYEATYKNRQHFSIKDELNPVSKYVTELPKTLARIIIAGENSAHSFSEIQTNYLKPIRRKTKDIGKVITRTNDTSMSIHGIDVPLETVEDIEKFIKTETEARKRDLKCSYTRRIQNHEWIAIVKLFENRLSKDHVKAVYIFKKFVTNKL